MALVLVGLGNPGRRYARSRHNAGFQVVECLAARFGQPLKRRRHRNYALGHLRVAGTRLTVVRPHTYMNGSGDIIKPVLSDCAAGVQELVVVCDTMDLAPGASRLRLSGSSAGNRGLASVLRVLRTEEVKRVYIGVGRPMPGVAVIDHVLSRPSVADAQAIAAAVERVCDHVDLLVEGDYQRAMNLINQRGATA